MKALELHIPENGAQPPYEEVPYYYASEKGWMTNMPTIFGVGQTLLKGKPPGLPKSSNGFQLNDRKFPEHLMMQAHSFFKAVWNKQQTESSLYILYNRETDEFRLWAPEQYVTMVAVNHRLGKVPNGWAPTGTIHSHCNFSAFHSGTDQHDMEGMPGLHITLGHVDHETPESALALSLGDNQFDVEYEDIIGDSADVQNIDELVHHPTHWMGFVKTGPAPWNDGVKTTYRKAPSIVAPWSQHKHPQTSMVPTGMSRQIQQNWDQQAWGNEDDWGDYLGMVPNEPRVQAPHDDVLSDVGATDVPSNIFNYYKNDLADFQYDLSMTADQLNDLGFVLNWSIAWDPTAAQQRMFDDAPTP
jgi:hypothetical protein